MSLLFRKKYQFLRSTYVLLNVIIDHCTVDINYVKTCNTKS